jgi:hypothetical protein
MKTSNDFSTTLINSKRRGRDPCVNCGVCLDKHLKVMRPLVLAQLQRVLKYAINWYNVGRDSTVGIATRCGLDAPGIESRWGRDFPQPSRPALGSTQPPVQWVTGLFPGIRRPGRGARHAIPSSCRGSRTGRAIPLLPLFGPHGLLQDEPLPLNWYYLTFL